MSGGGWRFFKDFGVLQSRAGSKEGLDSNLCVKILVCICCYSLTMTYSKGLGAGTGAEGILYCGKWTLEGQPRKIVSIAWEVARSWR